MNKVMLGFLFGTGILLGFSNFFHGNENMPIYIGALILVFLPIAFFYGKLRKTRNDRERRARSLILEAKKLDVVKREAKSKIPKNSPRRESQAAFVGSTKLGAARSMAALVRKPLLREKIIEICDFADLVLETIRRLPDDTPAAVTFCDSHLSRLNEALERCFEMHRHERKAYAGNASADAHEVECFSVFIFAFKKQQDSILFESLKKQA
jgi:hypothetical protein